MTLPRARLYITDLPSRMVNACVADITLRQKDSNFCQINPSRTKLYPSDLKTQIVPHSKHCASNVKTSQLMLCREIIAVCSEIHAKHINALWAEHRIYDGT